VGESGRDVDQLRPDRGGAGLAEVPAGVDPAARERLSAITVHFNHAALALNDDLGKCFSAAPFRSDDLFHDGVAPVVGLREQHWFGASVKTAR